MANYVCMGGPTVKRRLRMTDFWAPFHGNFICSQRFCQKSTERKSPKKYLFIFSFWCLPWDINLGLTSNKPTHYLLDYGNFALFSIGCLNFDRNKLINVCRQEKSWPFFREMELIDPPSYTRIWLLSVRIKYDYSLEKTLFKL